MRLTPDVPGRFPPVDEMVQDRKYDDGNRQRYTKDDGDGHGLVIEQGAGQITQENQQLSKRIKDMRERFSKNTPGEK